MNKKKEFSEYVDRDLSWFYFNHRILHEATKTTVPLLERLSFWEFIPIIWMSSFVYGWLR